MPFVEKSGFLNVEPITLVQAKSYLKIDSTDEDAYITELIATVREFVEDETNTGIVQQDITEYRDGFNTVITLQINGQIAQKGDTGYETVNTPKVSYLKDGSWIDLSINTDYYFSNYNGQPKIQAASNGWNVDPDERLNNVKISYVIKPTTGIPKPLVQAMYLLIGHFFDNRNAITYGNAKELPIGYKRIINQYKSIIWSK